MCVCVCVCVCVVFFFPQQLTLSSQNKRLQKKALQMQQQQQQQQSSQQSSSSSSTAASSSSSHHSSSTSSAQKGNKAKADKPPSEEGWGVVSAKGKVVTLDDDSIYASEDNIRELLDMGFDRARAVDVLKRTRGSFFF